MPDKNLPHGDRISAVQPQGLNGGAPGCCSTVKRRSVPRKMLRPLVLARMEERHDLPGNRIDAGKVRAFVAIAEGARESTIVQLAAAAVLPGNDVIDVERNFSQRFGEVAIFATIFRALADGPLLR